MSSIPNVVFINVPSLPLEAVQEHCGGKHHFSYLAMPTGILYLSAWAKKEGVINRSHILDYKLELARLEDEVFFDDFIIGNTNKVPFVPDIVAFSVNFTYSHDFLMTSAKMLKKIWPQAITIVGGHHATSCVAQILKNEAIDYVARGEGEIAFARFAATLKHHDSENIPGIYSKKNLDASFFGAVCEAVLDLDDLPHPDWELLDMDAYLSTGGTRVRSFGKDDTQQDNQRVATFSSSRGCPFQCTFCSSHLVHGRKMRFRSPDKVIEELCLLRDRYSANVFFPDDDLFTANKNRIKSILTMFKDKLSGCELQAPGGLSVNTLDLEILDLFIDTGTTVISLAVESGSEYVQRHVIKKRCNLNKAIDQVHHLRKRGVIVRAFFILGFPDETYKQMEETVDFAHRLEADWNAFSVALPLPGSEMYNEFLDMGAIDNDLDVWASNYSDERTFDTPDVSAKEVQDIAYFANVRVNFLENINFREGNYQRAMDLYNDVVNNHDFHIVGWYCVMECLSALGEEDEAERVNSKIRDLIAGDERAAAMYSKTHHLLVNMDHSGLAGHIDRKIHLGPAP